MEREKLIAFIQNVLPIPRQKVEEIASHFREMNVARNDFFIRQGEHSNRYLFLENGFMRAFTLDPDGNEVTTEFYDSGQVVFEVASFFRKTPSAESIQALENCEGWYITFDQLQLLFHSIPEFREFGRMVLVNGFITFKLRTLSMISEHAEQRYEALIRERPEVIRRAPLKYIASYLGITDSSLSRIRKK